jgi:hypothetical protein
MESSIWGLTSWRPEVPESGELLRRYGVERSGERNLSNCYLVPAIILPRRNIPFPRAHSTDLDVPSSDQWKPRPTFVLANRLKGTSPPSNVTLISSVSGWLFLRESFLLVWLHNPCQGSLHALVGGFRLVAWA